jgi:hypothetical protein
MKQLVAAMSEINYTDEINCPKIHGIVNANTGKYTKISMKDAITRAATLRPGDKLLISLISEDWVHQVRYPSIREESWTAMKIKKDKNSIITIPLPCCEMKVADFDGDEAQILCMYNHSADLELLLLNSAFAQMIGYKHSKCLIWFEEDVFFGLQRVHPETKINYYKGSYYKNPLSVTEIIEEFLPKNLTYADGKTCIKKGKFVDNRTNINNHELFKYIYMVYSPKICQEIMDKLIQLAYDINRDYGNTLGNVIRVFGESNKKAINEIIQRNYEKIKELELSSAPSKVVEQVQICNLQKAEIKKILLESSRNSPISNPNLAEKFLQEYYNMAVLLDYSIPGFVENRIQPSLADGSRVSGAFPKFTVDPVAYGYHEKGYTQGIPPYSHFMDCYVQMYNLFVKKAFTANQGYFSKKICAAFGD